MKEKVINQFKITSNLYWSFDDKRIYYNDKYIKLSRNEINFLELLIKFPNKVFSDEEIINSVWLDNEKNISSYSVKNLIKNLRKKLPSDIIENYYGVGYKLISSKKIIQNKIDFINGIKRVTTIVEKAKSSKELIKDVLEESRKIFNCDRVFLLYPLDIQTKTFEIPYEAINSQYPGAFELNTEIDMSLEQIEFFNKVLNAKEPISIGKDKLQNVKSYSTNLAKVNFIPPQSNLVWKIKPLIGKVWGIGLHQCSYDRVWNESEIELFKDIAIRLRDALSILLFNEDNRELNNDFLKNKNSNIQQKQIEEFIIKNRKFPIINEVIDNISYQLSQPFSILSLIIGKIDLKLKHLSVEDSELKNSLSLMDSEIKEIWKGIDKFKHLFKSSNKKEIFYISKAILDVKSLLMDSFLNSGIKFNIDIKDDGKIESYLNDFQQIIYYILVNIKNTISDFKKSKKIIKISLEKEDEKFLIRISNPTYFDINTAKTSSITTSSKKLDEITIYLSKVVIEKSLNGELIIRNDSNNMEFIIKIKGE